MKNTKHPVDFHCSMYANRGKCAEFRRKVNKFAAQIYAFLGLIIQLLSYSLFIHTNNRDIIPRRDPQHITRHSNQVRVTLETPRVEHTTSAITGRRPTTKFDGERSW